MNIFVGVDAQVNDGKKARLSTNPLRVAVHLRIVSIAPGIALMLAPYMQNVLPVSRADQIRRSAV